MIYIFRLIAALCIAAVFHGASSAQIGLPVDRENVTVCPASGTDTRPPATTGEGCELVTIWEVDPQGDHFWIYFDVPLNDLPEDGPYGLFVFAKASSAAYLNGQPIGENGTPADSQAGEIPGKMDHVFRLERKLMVPGVNQIAIRMSSHSGALRLRSPIHAIFISRYRSPQDATLRSYWPSLLPFGAFALSAFYFWSMAALGSDRLMSSLLAAMAAMASCQLLAEVSRGLIAYPYPFHDVRLLMILAFSAGFGLLLCTYVVFRFHARFRWWWLSAAIVAVLFALALPQGFDQKTSMSLLMPSLVAAVSSMVAVRTEKVAAGLFSFSLLLFALINILGAGQFLDQYFYYVVAVLLTFLFVQQAIALAREARLRQEEQARAEKLQYVIDQLDQGQTGIDLSIKSSGRILRINSRDIAYVSAAGDYAELTLVNGDTHLHGTTLSDLESELPAYFLRVHRSYLVNSSLIESLERKPSGTGELSLSTSHKVPVSRRIMPSIRAALA